MQTSTTWAGFLAMLFAIVGLCGMFASYATLVPFERGAARNEALDRAAATEGTAGLEPLRRDLGPLAETVIDAPGPLPVRIAQARRIIADEQGREAASVAYRVRLTLGVITVVAAALGVGILKLVRRNALNELPPAADDIV